MTHHLSDDQLIGYIHRTLNDVEREVIDRHTATCTACRARLGQHEELQRRLRYGLLAELRDVRP